MYIYVYLYTCVCGYANEAIHLSLYIHISLAQAILQFAFFQLSDKLSLCKIILMDFPD